MSGDWRRRLADSLVSIEELAERYELDPAETVAVAQRYPCRITRHYFELIKVKGDPLWLQAVPDIRELEADSQQSDPLNENGLSPVPGLIHRYPDRVVWLVANECALYCRFCLRKRGVGCSSASSTAAFKDALQYIAANSAIRDVILSGGDPLLLEDEQLADILSALREIPHLEIIRIGSRIPVTFPERITPTLASLLRRFQPLYINTHFNHPREITQASRQACALLVDAGIPLGNQTVLLKGVNDNPAVMTELLRGLLAIRVKPYYLHQMDLVKGTAHFRTSVRTGLEIMAALRGHLSGLAVPYYVIDLPAGKGKVPLLPGHEIRADGGIKLMTYCGEIVEYLDIN